MQTEGALGIPECAPLLGLLDDLGHSRSEIYQLMLSSSLEILKRRIPHLSDDALVRLLEASFAYVRIEDLQEVPLEVLKNLKEVPPAFLKQVCFATSLPRRAGVLVPAAAADGSHPIAAVARHGPLSDPPSRRADAGVNKVAGPVPSATEAF